MAHDHDKMLFCFLLSNEDLWIFFAVKQKQKLPLGENPSDKISWTKWFKLLIGLPAIFDIIDYQIIPQNRSPIQGRAERTTWWINAYYEKWKIISTKGGIFYSQQTKVKSEPYHIHDCQIILQNHSPIPGRGREDRTMNRCDAYYGKWKMISTKGGLFNNKQTVPYLFNDK